MNWCCGCRDKEKNSPAQSNIMKQDLSERPQKKIYTSNQGNQCQQNIQENILITTWNQECINNGFDRQSIQKLKQYDNLIIFINKFFYYSEKSLKQNPNQPKHYECEGKLYQTDYDQNNNPKFIMKQGNFLINFKEKPFKIVERERDIRPLEKSNIIDRDFEINNKQQVQFNLNKNDEKNKNKIIKIIDSDSNEQVNHLHSDDKQQIYKQQQNLKIWCKFNQQISTKDVNILSNKLWMTSSIIDSYILYLDQQSDEYYFKLSQKERETKKRILLFPSSLTTNFGDDYEIDKVRYLFEQEKPQFMDINFELSQLYHYIGFPVNKKNRHWQFLLFELTTKKVFVFDSLSISKQVQDKKLINSIAQIFNLNQVNIQKHDYSGEQRDNYSCGYRVCSIMKFYCEKQLQENSQYQYNEEDMIKLLQELIKDS